MHLLYSVLQVLQLRSVDSGLTSIQFFTDSACQNASFVVQTDTNIADGQCGDLTGDGISSVNISMLLNGCTVTTYVGPWCTDDPTSVTPGSCEIRSIGSYSVDCPDINGTVNGTYTTIPAESSSTLSGSLPSSTSEAPSALSQQDSSTTVQSASPSAIVPPSPTTFGKAASSTSTRSSFAASSSTQTPTLSATALQSPASSPPSSSLSSTSSSPAITGSSKGGGNKRIRTIVPSVTIPVAIVVISVITYVIRRRKSKLRKPAVRNEDDMRKAVELRSPPSSGIQPPPEPNTVDNTDSGTAPASDTGSANSDFSSLHTYPQAELKNRTAEARSP